MNAATDDDLSGILIASILDVYRVPDTPMTAHDRCDACGAGALTRFHWPPTEEHPKRRGELQFCGHHTNKLEPELLGNGWAVAVRNTL